MSSVLNKVLIVPANTDLNRGDQSLTWESIEIAKEVFTPAEIFLYKSRNHNSLKENANYQTTVLGHKFLSRILLHPRRSAYDESVRYGNLATFKWGIRALLDTLITLILLSKFKLLNKISLSFLSADQQKTYQKFKELDAVIVKGGGFLHGYGGIKDAYIMYYQLYDVFLASKFGISVYVLPNSIGPLKNKVANWIVKLALSKASKVFVRESVSKKFLNDQGIKAFLSPDLGFYLKPSKEDFSSYLEERNVVLKNKRNVAITLRPYRFDGTGNYATLYENYLNQFRVLIRSLIKDGYGVSLIAHTLGPSAHENDCIPLQEVFQEFNKNKEVQFLVDKSLNCKDIEKIYEYYDLVIGTRFHSVIFALNVGTPVIAIAYGGYKAVGIMNDLDLSKFVVPIEDPDSSKILSLVSEAFEKKSEIKLRIQKYRSNLSDQREKLITIIKSDLKEKNEKAY